MSELPVLETERLLLRPLTGEDFEDFARMMADDDVTRFLGGPAPRPRAWAQLARFLGHGVLRGYSQNAVVEKATGAFLGRAGPWFAEGWPAVEIGWVLARRAWGHGYATEAGAAWRDWAFATLDVDELISVIHPENTASIRVAERIGSTASGTAVLPDDPRRHLRYAQRRPSLL